MPMEMRPMMDTVEHVQPDVDDDVSNWVPTGHPFSEVLKHYLAYRQAAGIADSLSDFRDWLLSNQIAGTPETARSYCFPVREREFNLAVQNVGSLQIIAQGGWAGLLAANRGSDFFLPGEARHQVCLVDVWLAGYVHEQALL